MIAVAVAGLLLGTGAWGWRMKRRRDYYLLQAHIHGWWEKFARFCEQPPVLLTGGRPLARDVLNVVERISRSHDIVLGGRTSPAPTFARYHEELRIRYEAAAARPWVALPRNSPLP
jgi:hypothetical protein